MYAALKACPLDCSGNGLCLNGMCVCNVGFTGPACDGVTCAPGFGGPQCDVHLCPNDCTGRGLCFDGECSCSDTFVGRDCSLPMKCLDPCQHACQRGEAAGTPACNFCVGSCLSAEDNFPLGRHNPFDDLQATLLQVHQPLAQPSRAALASQHFSLTTQTNGSALLPQGLQPVTKVNGAKLGPQVRQPSAQANSSLPAAQAQHTTTAATSMKLSSESGHTQVNSSRWRVPPSKVHDSRRPSLQANSGALIARSQPMPATANGTRPTSRIQRLMAEANRLVLAAEQPPLKVDASKLTSVAADLAKVTPKPRQTRGRRHQHQHREVSVVRVRPQSHQEKRLSARLRRHTEVSTVQVRKAGHVAGEAASTSWGRGITN